MPPPQKKSKILRILTDKKSIFLPPKVNKYVQYIFETYPSLLRGVRRYFQIPTLHVLDTWVSIYIPKQMAHKFLGFKSKYATTSKKSKILRILTDKKSIFLPPKVKKYVQYTFEAYPSLLRDVRRYFWIPSLSHLGQQIVFYDQLKKCRNRQFWDSFWSTSI